MSTRTRKRELVITREQPSPIEQAVTEVPEAAAPEARTQPEGVIRDVRIASLANRIVEQALKDPNGGLVRALWDGFAIGCTEMAPGQGYRIVVTGAALVPIAPRPPGQQA